MRPLVLMGAWMEEVNVCVDEEEEATVVSITLEESFN